MQPVTLQITHAHVKYQMIAFQTHLADLGFRIVFRFTHPASQQLHSDPKSRVSGFFDVSLALAIIIMRYTQYPRLGVAQTFCGW
jgi:hypothetical protein